MIPVVAQIPSVRIHDAAPVLIVGFDATHALCVEHDGRLAYVEMGDLIVDWMFDAEAEIWVSRLDAVEAIDVEPEEGPGSDDDGALREG